MNETEPPGATEMVRRMGVVLEIAANLAFLTSLDAEQSNQVRDHMKKLDAVIEEARCYLRLSDDPVN